MPRTSRCCLSHLIKIKHPMFLTAEAKLITEARFCNAQQAICFQYIMVQLVGVFFKELSDLNA